MSLKSELISSSVFVEASKFESDSVLTFQPVLDLPFPLNLSIGWRTFIFTLLFTILISGLVLRAIILGYLNDPEANSGLINYLFWVDQLCGLLSSVSLMFTMAAMIVPVPIGTILGDQFCQWIRFPAGLYICGAIVWSCFIAVIRLLYISPHDCIKFKIGERNVLVFFLVIGGLLNLVSTLVLVKYDNESFLSKLCSHSSTLDIKLLQDYTFLTDETLLESKKFSIFILTVVSITFSGIEFFCYAMLFYHLYIHDNTIASTVLQPAVIRQRNRSNAVSIIGLVASWIMEMWYVLLGGLITLIYSEKTFVRETGAVFKMLEFALVPFVQILTSKTIKQYYKNKIMK